MDTQLNEQTNQNSIKSPQIVEQTNMKTYFKTLVKNPIVDIKILNKEITVLGEVREPKVITVDKSKNKLLDIIGHCKGFEFYANLKYVKVFRQIGENVHVANIDLTKEENILLRNIDLRPGDVVVVPSKKYKEFDKRVSIIIPLTTSISAASLLLGLF